MLDPTFVSCHLFDVFPTATNKISPFKTIVCIVCIPLYLSYLTPKPLDQIEDEWRWTGILWTDDSVGRRAMDSKHGGSLQENFDCKEVFHEELRNPKDESSQAGGATTLRYRRFVKN